MILFQLFYFALQFDDLVYLICLVFSISRTRLTNRCFRHMIVTICANSEWWVLNNSDNIWLRGKVVLLYPARTNFFTKLIDGITVFFIKIIEFRSWSLAFFIVFNQYQQSLLILFNIMQVLSRSSFSIYQINIIWHCFLWHYLRSVYDHSNLLFISVRVWSQCCF